MITVDALREIPIFAPLPESALTYLAGAVEDIRLSPGEYFAHEGDERALFVVIEGGAEITKVINGEERVIGRRRPGHFFGEVPMTLSTPFPASGRAGVASRVIKLDAAVFYTLAAAAPSVPARVAGLARAYLDSLQEMAAEQPATLVRVVGPRRDAGTHALVGFLTRNQVAFDRVTLDEPSADGHPVLETAGTRLVDPPMRAVAELVGLDVEPASARYDLVILGAGPAGLTAAVNGAAEGLTTVVIEGLAPGGQAGTSTRIENYTGFPFGISGDDLASRALKQAKRLGAEIVVTRTVTAIEPRGDRSRITLDGGTVLEASMAVIATGVAWRTLPVAGIERFLGSGVYYGAARSDSSLAQGADVCIVGAGNSAGQAALFFSRHARSVTILVRGPSLATSMSRYLIDQIVANDGIRVAVGSQITGFHGGAGLEAIDVHDADTGRTERRDAAVVFVMIGADAATGWLPPAIARDAHGFIVTGPDAADTPQWTAPRRPFALETSAPGVFAVGDVRSGSVKRVAAGVGEGGMAVAFAHAYLALPR
ncbi:FAD-dependent oxidoreductase [Microbacterium elymi]|uniref:FAD-dependent oxidoreductase n=1 Tax=Microbacterium elymi TaxID=2909587 RepID=A0ABY5NJY3_9MICO|nr:FAD-dependent oxidoreductase [Microbacterium elymi]UUT35480.1 FAD-dependent oxidoreductase [Microbacterium elymi]